MIILAVLELEVLVVPVVKLLALDQASRTSGFAVFEDEQLITSGTFTLTQTDIGKRLVAYKQHIEKLIEDYDIEQVVFEDIQMQGQINNVHTFKILAEIYGVTEEFLAESGLVYEVYGASHWRSQLKIPGKARSEQKKAAQKYVEVEYGKKVSQDEADAVCLGAAFIKEHQKKEYNWE